MTATVTFDLLGASNTIPSSSRPPSATFTSSLSLVRSIGPSVLRPLSAVGTGARVAVSSRATVPVEAQDRGVITELPSAGLHDRVRQLLDSLTRMQIPAFR